MNPKPRRECHHKDFQSLDDDATHLKTLDLKAWDLSDHTLSAGYGTPSFRLLKIIA
jgi:hypothetical protein